MNALKALIWKFIGHVFFRNYSTCFPEHVLKEFLFKKFFKKLRQQFWKLFQKFLLKPNIPLDNLYYFFYDFRFYRNFFDTLQEISGLDRRIFPQFVCEFFQQFLWDLINNSDESSSWDLLVNFFVISFDFFFRNFSFNLIGNYLGILFGKSMHSGSTIQILKTFKTPKEGIPKNFSNKLSEEFPNYQTYFLGNTQKIWFDSSK